MTPDPTLTCLLRQLDTASRLARYHIDSLGDDECLWRPAKVGLHVHRQVDGRWQIDWPEHEGYDLGPPSIAWILWHIGFWWSMAIDHSFGEAGLTRGQVTRPGSAVAARDWIYSLESDWRKRIERLSTAELHAMDRTRWPFRDRPFADVIAWVNIELTKNAAEIGYARFLYASRPQ